MTVASQYIFENVMYVKKNIKDFAKIGDVHNIKTRNKSKFIASNPITSRPYFFYVYAFTTVYNVYVFSHHIIYTFVFVCTQRNSP